MWRFSGLLLGALLLCGSAIWWARVEGAGTDAESVAGAIALPPVSLPAQPLPAAAKQPALVPTSAAGARPLYDPIVVTSCNLVPLQEQDVSSQIDGEFREVLVDLGGQVTRGQVLGRLDDGQLRPQVELLQIKAASRSAELIAKAQHDEAAQRVEYALKANKSGLRSVSELEYQTYFYQRERFAEEMKKAREDQEVARKELERARRMLELHEIRSGIAGEVVKVYKRSGEAVKQTEPLFRVASFTRLRIEGLCRVKQADLIRVGMRALVEPELASEQMTELSGHTAAVTGVAVSPDGRWVASASEDHTVLLWSWPQAVRLAVLPHPAEVHAVALAAATAGKAGTRLLTGCADGRIRVWSLSDRGAVEGPVLWSPGHEGAVRAVAISPDGAWCATAGEDRRVGLWEAATGRHVSWLQADGERPGTAHQGAVTWVQFTPDRHLISAGRDNVLLVWKLEGNGAALAATHPGRTGEVAHLGVSSDGRHVLFDHGEELRILDRNNGASVGSLRSRRQGRFQGVALFSPTNRLLLAGASNGRLQLWRVPASPEQIALFRQGYAHGFGRSSLLALSGLGGVLTPAGTVPNWAALSGSGRELLPQLWGLHGQEIRQFLTPSTAALTCGAFAPDESVVFTGGTDRIVRVWPVPPRNHWDGSREATITFVGSHVERGTDQVRIRAEMDNADDLAGRLRPGTYADLRLYPEAAR